jgi:hypothetical protein
VDNKLISTSFGWFLGIVVFFVLMFVSIVALSSHLIEIAAFVRTTSAPRVIMVVSWTWVRVTNFTFVS